MFLSFLVMEIYFSGSIRSGRQDQPIYVSLISHLHKYGTVLTAHIGDAALTDEGDFHLSDGVIYQRDMDWLKKADVVVAEVSNPSLGVGYEIAQAEVMGKPLQCLYQTGLAGKVSPMVTGNSEIRVCSYLSIYDAYIKLDEFFKSIRND